MSELFTVDLLLWVSSIAKLACQNAVEVESLKSCQRHSSVCKQRQMPLLFSRTSSWGVMLRHVASLWFLPSPWHLLRLQADFNLLGHCSRCTHLAFLFVCICVCTCMYTCLHMGATCTCMCMCLCGNQRSALDIAHQVQYTLCFEIWSLPGLELTSEYQGPFCHHIWLSLYEFWGSNSCPYACIASALVTEPHLIFMYESCLLDLHKNPSVYSTNIP